MTGRARSTGRQRAVGGGAAEQPAKQTRLTDNFPVVRGPPRAARLDKPQPKAAVAASAAERTATLAASEPRRTRAAAAAAAVGKGSGAAPKRQRRGAKTVDTDDDEPDSDVELVQEQEEQEDDGGVVPMETSSQEGASEEEQEAEARRRPSRRAAAAGVAAAVPAVSGPGRSRTASGGAVATAPTRSTAAHAPAGPGAVERPRRSGRAAAAAPADTCLAKARGSTKATAGSRKGHAAAAAATGKGSRTARSSGPRYFDKYEVEDEVYGRGDDVYVIETDDASLLPNGDEDEACCVCKRNTNTNRMVECDRCLRGFHMGCLRPKLTRVPEGDWLCPDCEKGIPPDSEGRELVTSSQVFLFGRRVLGLARVMGWVRNRTGDGGVEVILRHYQKPEETHVGRQKHHQAREVFLGVTECAEPAECIWGRAQVVRPDRLADTPGTDVYICEYEYDEKWKRFRRRLYGDEDGAVSDDDQEWGAAAAAGAIAGGAAARAAATGRRGGRGAAAADGSTSEGDSEADEEYKPRNTLDGWVIRKARPGQQRTSGRTMRGAGRTHAYKGIIDEHGTGLLADQGAAAVPERGPVGPLAAARRALALNCRDGGLPCREGEKATLRRFIGQAVEEGGDSPGVLYICGVPGTGKTACVMEVLGGVRQQAQQNGVQLVIINALQLPSPQHVYSKLWERIAGVRWGPARALAALEEAFSGGGAVRQGGGGSEARHMTLLLVDEIDVLITKDQAVLYNLFEWPLREGSRLAVIGISNTHDLDSRVLPRIASRLSGSKLAFNPYNFDQLKEILNHRLQGSTAFAKAAVDFCARKVASTTGDVRRALELLRRATELAEAGLAARQQREARAAAAGGAGGQVQGGPEQQQQQQQQQHLVNVVTIKEAQAAIREMYGSAHMALLRAAGLVPKLLLVALCMELRATKKPEATVAALHHRLNSHLLLLTKDAGLPLPRVVEAAAALGAQRLVAAEAGWQGPGMRLSLNVPEDDVVALLREDPSLAAVQSCLA